ncbi:HlyD family secretion protein [Acetobacteraceae bacterium KSS8]|uniref:HlyD family secretion protein n=1 Tax=Endosaccharibacter trunci TaxID=2812733 RepID=A0ABT1W2E2_9PROT|nr:HlyD family secretion protein [Acetobacteraceae bacterium KSS8]
MAEQNGSEDSQDQHDQNSDGADQPGQKNDESSKREQQEDEARKKRSPFIRVGLAIFALVLVVGGFFYWFTTRNLVSTDDAFTAGRTVTIAPHVGGYVVELDVNDNQFVHEGQVLARIDPRDYQAAVDRAQAAVDQAKGQLEGAKFGVEVAKKNFPGQLKQAQGQLALAQAQQFRAETDYARQHSIERAATTQQQVDYSTAALEQAKAQVLQAEGQVEVASPIQAQVSTQQTRVTQQSAALADAEAQLATARLNLEWTVLRAPHDGWIAQRNVERGRLVQSGQSLFAVVQPDLWITANFKETQITRLRPGQPVSISVDAYPDMKLTGHVGSIQRGTGSSFSTFPPENATGNFVKIVQRVPVKIIIDDGLDPLLPLPIGLSVEPTVNVAPANPK